MTFLNILLENFVTFCLIFGLIILIFSNKTFEKSINRHFISFVILVLLLTFTDICDYYMQGFDEVNNFRYFTSSLGYILRPSALAIILSIMLRRKDRFLHYIWLPIIILGIIAFSNYFTHFIFYFDDNNIFIRNNLGFLPHLLSLVYAIVIGVLLAKSYKETDFYEIIIVLYIIFISASAAIIEMYFNVKFFLPGAMAVSCTLYYMFLYVETYKKDALTGLFNRRTLYSDLCYLVNQKVAVISMDLNGLKEINDKQGHNAGDKAISTFAKICLKVANSQFKIYRTGGDEFLALGKNITEKEANLFIKKIKKELIKKGYMCSFGYEQYQGNTSFDEVLNNADIKMYEDKKTYKHRRTIR